MKRTARKLSAQIKKHASRETKPKSEYDGNVEKMIPTGSTLLDLAISGGRVRGGGIPAGIFVEIFGPPGAGKTVLLCEIAGAVQRQGGEVMFRDPEARLNKQFAAMFGLHTNEIEYDMPDTISKVFAPIRSWDLPKGKIHGVFADSLAALTTEYEINDKDKYGMRRAKEFSEELRKTCRVIPEKNILMVCSNQIRQNPDAGMYGPKDISPGGKAISFYSSLRLRCSAPRKIKKEKTIKGKEVSRVIGVETSIEVHKSSIWQPNHVAPVTILFDYGIDDIRENLKYLKQWQYGTTYQVGDLPLGKAMDKAIIQVEEKGLEGKLKEETIDLWEDIESHFFGLERKPKR